MPRQPFNLPIPWWWDAEGAMMGGDDVIGSRTTTMMVRGNNLGMQQALHRNITLEHCRTG